MRRSIPVLALSALLLATGARAVAASAAGYKSSPAGPCRARAWINAFAPAMPMRPRPGERCDADLQVPLFTREGALFCPSLDAFYSAYNAMERGWTYVPTAGSATPDGWQPGDAATPALWGCQALHDGHAVTLLGRPSTIMVRTDIGWTMPGDLRNAPHP